MVKPRGEQNRHPGRPAPRVVRIFNAPDATTDPSQLNLPGFNLHPLKGARKGEWSMCGGGDWRVTFRFAAGDAYDVNLEDYH